jgi:hypothetical protein
MFFLKPAVTLLLCLVALAAPAQEPLRVSYRAPENDQDRRLDYPIALLRLALEKTVASHGAYRFELTPAMNKRRSILAATQQTYGNNFVMLSYEPSLTQQGLDYVRFPVHLGVIGYRVCFMAPGLRERLAQVRSLDELRRFSIGQGAGWQDVQLLRSHGFEVTEVASYESLFAMINKGRFDLLCRSANDVLGEVSSRPELELDRSFALVYPLPQFLYTHKSNSRARERIAAGLKLAYADGSLLKLFKQHYQASLDYAGLNKRRIFRLANPALASIDFDFQKYDFKLPGVGPAAGVKP